MHGMFILMLYVIDYNIQLQRSSERDLLQTMHTKNEEIELYPLSNCMCMVSSLLVVEKVHCIIYLYAFIVVYCVNLDPLAH